VAAAPRAAVAVAADAAADAAAAAVAWWPAWNMEVTISQDASTITVERTQGQATVKFVVKLDGSDSKNSITMGQNTVDQTQKATWEGAKLTITSSYDMGRGPTTTKQTLSLDGGNLTVENFGADGTSMSKVTYKKS
jgi:hypothetical protein